MVTEDCPEACNFYFYSLFSSTDNIWLDSMLWKNLYSVMSCIVELRDEDSVIHCIVSCRQIDKSGCCNHAPLTILYVLSEVLQLAGA